MSHVFISYSRKDSTYAHRLASELSRWGIETWIDSSIDYGANFPRVIQENLNNSFAFIVIMSPSAYNSDWVQNEVSYAQGKGKAIFPILLDGDVWVSLAAKQYADGRNEELPPKGFYDNLLRYETRLKYPESEYVKMEFLYILTKSQFDFEKGKIVFSIEDESLRHAIQRQLKEKGILANSSFNTELVKIEKPSLEVLIRDLYGEEIADDFRKGFDEMKSQLESDNIEVVKEFSNTITASQLEEKDDIAAETNNAIIQFAVTTIKALGYEYIKSRIGF